MAHRIGMRAGWSLDLQAGYDQTGRATRAWANKQLKADDPWLTFTCPPCEPMSQLNIGLNYPKTPIDTVTDKLDAGLEHLNYAMEICELRHQANRYFLHEHPRGCASWDAPSVRRARELEGVIV